MAFKELREFSKGRYLELPIDGVTYRIEDVDAETGLLIQRIMDVGLEAAQGDGDLDLDDELLDDARELSLYEDTLGEALQAMKDNGVPWADVKRAATTAMIWVCFDEEAAEKYWMSGGTAGEAPAPETGRPPSGASRGARRASSAAARTTRKRVSGTSTKAKPSRSAARKATPGSRGRTSGSSGA